MAYTIVENKAQCRQCDDVIQSMYRWDYVTCGCGAIAVDGGLDYLKRTGEMEDIKELSVTIPADALKPKPPIKYLYLHRYMA